MMSKMIRSSIVAGCALALVACGSGVGDGPKVATKEKAAALLLGVANTAQGNGSGSGTIGSQLRSAVKQQKQAKQDELESACPKGGKLKGEDMVVLLNGKELDVEKLEAETADLNPSDLKSFGFKMKMSYDACAFEFDDPETEAVETDEVILDGGMKVDVVMDAPSESSNAFKMMFKLDGDVRVTGALDDKLETKIVQTLVVNLSEETPDISLTLDGHAKTATEDYSFDNETFTFGGEYGGGMGEEFSAASSEFETGGFEYGAGEESTEEFDPSSFGF